MKNFNLKLSAWAGIVSLLISIPLGLIILDIDLNLPKPVLALMLGSSAVSYFVFMLGFLYLGKKQNNIVLIIFSVLLVLISALDDLFLFLSQTDDYWEVVYNKPIVTMAFAFTFGLSWALHGYFLTKLKSKLDGLVKRTGWLEILCGGSLASIILSPLALLLLVPTYIMQIKLLFNAGK